MDAAIYMVCGGLIGVGLTWFLSSAPVTCMTKVQMKTVDGPKVVACGCPADLKYQVFRCPEGHETRR